MPSRHVNLIVLTACLSMLCYVVQKRTKTALVVGDAMAMIDAYYVDPVDPEDLLLSAMNGMTSGLDDHSEFIPEQDYQSFQDSIQQEFAGIGIYVEQPEPEQPVRVVTPLVGSPALEAGLLPGDQILQVNSEDVSKMNLPDVSQRLKGPVGTTVELVVSRKEKKIDLTVRRDRIELDSVIGDHRDTTNQWVYRLKQRPEIAYLRLTGFGDRTTSEVKRILTELNNDFDGLILDLRGNGGGLLTSAVEISDMFLDEGRIVSTRTRGGKLEDLFEATSGTLVDSRIPVSVLIDQDSASASEIVAACLQDQQRARIVGKRSYGKGTVQHILPLQYGRSALRLTVAKYYRPNGQNIHRQRDATESDQWGVFPDEGYDVNLDESTLQQLAKRWREASYPLLATANNDAENNDAENNDGKTQPSNEEASDWSATEDRLDTQLWAAVDGIRKTKADSNNRVSTEKSDGNK